MITKTEKQLIHLTKMNSDDGFAELARRYQPLMYKLASEFIDGGRLSPDELPDLMQEMLMTLHRVANTFDQKQGEVTFGLYLKICLTNCLAIALMPFLYLMPPIWYCPVWERFRVVEYLPNMIMFPLQSPWGRW